MGLSLLQSASVTVDLMDNRLPTLLRLRTAGPIVIALREVRPKLAAAATRAAKQEEADPVYPLALQQARIGAALAKGLEAHAADMFAPDEVRMAANELYASMLDGHLGVRQSHADRVGAATMAHAVIAARDEEIALMSDSVKRLVNAWIEAGDAVCNAMRQRFPLNDGPPPTASELVLKVKSILARLRAAIRHELSIYDDLPADLETQLLGPADYLGGPRRKTTKASVEVEVEAEGPDVSAPVVIPKVPTAPIESTRPSSSTNTGSGRAEVRAVTRRCIE